MQQCVLPYFFKVTQYQVNLKEHSFRVYLTLGDIRDVCSLLQSRSVPPLVLGKATTSLHQALFKVEPFSLGLSIHVNGAEPTPGSHSVTQWHS